MACCIGLRGLSYLPLRPVVWNHTLRQSVLIICSFFHFPLFILSFFTFHFSFFIPSCSFLFPAAKIQQKGSFVNTFCQNTYSALIINQLTSCSFPGRKNLPGLCCAWAGSLSPKSVHAESPCEKNSPKIWRFGRKGLPLQQFQRIYIMCTYNITVDEQVIAKISPSVSREDFGALLQLFVDEFVDSLVSTHGLPPRSHTAEEMYAIVKERLHSIESGNAKFVDGESVFESLRARYGFKTQVA